MEIPKLAIEEDRKAAFDATKLAVARGADSRVPQAIPPGTTEASVPALEREMVDLPSKDYFLKVLDRPHYEGEDANGNPPWDGGYTAPAAPQPAQPDKQVRNEVPVAKGQ